MPEGAGVAGAVRPPPAGATPAGATLAGPTPAGRTLTASASSALGALLRSPARPGAVLGVFRSAVYVSVGRGGGAPVVALVSADGVALPNALVVGWEGARAPFAGAEPAVPALVGEGAVVVGSLTVRAVRWWDPRPRVGALRPGDLRRGLDELDRELARPIRADRRAGTGAYPPDWHGRLGALAAAACCLDGAAAAEAARRLVGYGPGLTPAGDDVLAGFLAAARLLCGTVEAPDAAGPFGDELGRAGRFADERDEPGKVIRFADELGGVVRSLAAERTTALSATLLAHAGRGEVPRPVAALLSALAGHGAVAPAARRLMGVGHTSGADLATGIAIAARAVLAARAGLAVLAVLGGIADLAATSSTAPSSETVTPAGFRGGPACHSTKTVTRNGFGGRETQADHPEPRASWPTPQGQDNE